LAKRLAFNRTGGRKTEWYGHKHGWKRAGENHLAERSPRPAQNLVDEAAALTSNIASPSMVL
jgi:hypothetical protein